jgi:hypothetical protein
VAYAAHERCKNKRRDDHLDQAQKYIGDNGEIVSYRSCRSGIGQHPMQYEADKDAEKERAKDEVRKATVHSITRGTDWMQLRTATYAAAG